MNTQYSIRSIASCASLVGLMLASASSSAATISYSTRAITTGVNTSDYAASYAAQTSTITTQSLPDFVNRFGGQDTFSHLVIDFTVGGAFASNSFSFQLAPDAAYGGALYLDGALVDIDTTDLWWNMSWSAISDLLQTSGSPSFVGSHQLVAYWAEDCCSGRQSARFSTNGGASYQDMTVANLNALNVAEPGTLAIVGLGLFAAGLTRRRHN